MSGRVHHSEDLWCCWAQGLKLIIFTLDAVQAQLLSDEMQSELSAEPGGQHPLESGGPLDQTAEMRRLASKDDD